MSIDSYISLIRSASSAYEMRSEMIGAFQSLNNDINSLYSIVAPDSSAFGICTKENYQNFWGLIENADNIAFPIANLYVIGEKIINTLGNYNARNDNFDAYYKITYEYSKEVELSDFGTYSYGSEEPVTKLTVKNVKFGNWITSVIERNISDLWDVGAPDPTVEHAYAYCSSLSRAYFSDCSFIGYSAFINCKALTIVSFPVCSIIADCAFEHCISLSSIFFPNCSIIRTGAFFACSNLSSISFPVCKLIDRMAFNYCYSLSNISFPECSEISISAFGSCSALTSVEFQSCILIRESAFYRCIKLYEISFPVCTQILSSAFISCYSLSSIYLPECSKIEKCTFMYCSNIKSVSLPKCNIIGASAFARCSLLQSITFESDVSIYNYAFASCYNLISIYLLGSSIATLVSYSAFFSTPISNYSLSAGRYGNIFVPSSLYQSYISATNWSIFSSRIISI